MFSGSSGLINAGRQQLVTPNLRVKISPGDHQTTNAISLPTSSSVLFQGTMFQNQLVIWGTSGVQTFSADGTTILGLGPSGTVSPNGTAAMDMFNAGDTLHIFYGGYNGTTPVLNHATSADGLAWSAPEIVHAGSIAGSGQTVVFSVAAAGPTRVYAMVRRGVTGNYALNLMAQIRVSGTTWGSTQIYTPFLVQAPNDTSLALTGQFTAAGSTMEDFVFANTSPVLSGATYGGMGLISFRVADRDITEVRSLIFADANTNLQIQLGKIGVGLSEYYLPIRSTDGNVLVGSDAAPPIRMELGVLKSPNLRDWSAPLLFRSSHSYLPILIPGTSTNQPFKYSMLGLSRFVAGQWIQVAREAVQLDVSGDIISYSNMNNDRVTLDLVNMS